MFKRAKIWLTESLKEKLPFKLPNTFYTFLASLKVHKLTVPLYNVGTTSRSWTYFVMLFLVAAISKICQNWYFILYSADKHTNNYNLAKLSIRKIFYIMIDCDNILSILGKRFCKLGFDLNRGFDWGNVVSTVNSVPAESCTS